MFKIYPSVTSTTKNWRELIKEVKNLGLTEICFFPTNLTSKERREAYQLLDQTQIKKIPLVHLRHDMNEEEIKYFTEKYKTEIFNIHSQLYSHCIFKIDLKKYKNIYLENVLSPLDEETKNFAGICLDTAHLEHQRLVKSDLFNNWIECLNKFPVGGAHLSAISQKPCFIEVEGSKIFGYDSHKYTKLSELDYVKRYKKYLPEIIALELENSISEQLEAIKYLEKILKIEN